MRSHPQFSGRKRRRGLQALLVIALGLAALTTVTAQLAIPASFSACAIQCVRSASLEADCSFVALYIPAPSCACNGASLKAFGGALGRCFDQNPTCPDRVAVVSWWQRTLCSSGGAPVVETTANMNMRMTTMAPTTKAPVVRTTKKKVPTTKAKKSTTTTKEPTEAPFTISFDPSTSQRTTKTKNPVFTVTPSATKYVPGWKDPSQPFPFEPSSGGRNRPDGPWTLVGKFINLPWSMKMALALSYGAFVALARMPTGIALYGLPIFVALVGMLLGIA